MHDGVEQSDFIKKNLRHNFTFNALDGASFWFGNSFYSPSIILPVFLTHFTSNPLILGLIPFIATAGFLVPQLFSSPWVERAPVKKVFPVNYGFLLERVPIALLVPATFFLSIRYPVAALIVTLLLFSWHTVGAGLILVGWQDMIAKVIPTEQRGRFFGLTNFLGMGSGIAGAALVTWLLGAAIFPMGFVWAFSFGAVFTFLSWAFLAQTREPPDKITRSDPVRLGSYFKSIPHLMKGYPNFRHYIVGVMLMAVSGLANGFLIVYAVQRWQLPDSHAASYTILFMIGQAIANPILGWLGDRYGHKFVLEISAAANILALAIAVVAPLSQWFYVIFFFRGVFQAGNFLSGVSIVMEFSEPDVRPTFIGLANTLPGLVGAVAPLLGGLMASLTGYQPLFALAVGLGLLALAYLRFRVKEPRWNKDRPVVLP